MASDSSGIDRWAAWLQIAGNIGILAGLILVAIEVNQTTASIRGSAYQGWMAANVELNMAFAEEVQSLAAARGLQDSSDLTEETYMAFAMWHMAAMQMAQATDFMYRTGTIDKRLWEVEMGRVAGMLTLPGVRQWWDAGAKTQLDPRFVDVVESFEPSGQGWRWEPDQGFVSGAVKPDA